MQDNKTKNTADKKISIETELTLSFSKLAPKALPEFKEAVVNLLKAKPDIINCKVEKIVRKIIGKKKLDLKLTAVEHAYNDSENLTHGGAHFKVTLEGTENALRKVAGENRLFFFDWKTRHAN